MPNNFGGDQNDPAYAGKKKLLSFAKKPPVFRPKQEELFAVLKFKDVLRARKDVDPNGDLHWPSLAIGYLINAMGITPKRAHLLMTYMRKQLELL